MPWRLDDGDHHDIDDQVEAQVSVAIDSVVDHAMSLTIVLTN